MCYYLYMGNNISLKNLRSLEDQVLLEGKEGFNEALLEIGNKRMALLKSQNFSLKKSPFSSEFRSHFPLSLDLESESFESNFLSRVLWIAKKIQKNNSPNPFLSYLSEEQKREVFLFSGGKCSPEGLGFCIKRYIKELQTQVKIAEYFYFEDVKKGMKLLQKLDLDHRWKVEKKISDLQKQGKKCSKEWVSSLMLLIEEQMGMHPDF